MHSNVLMGFFTASILLVCDVLGGPACENTLDASFLGHCMFEIFLSKFKPLG